MTDLGTEATHLQAIAGLPHLLFITGSLDIASFATIQATGMVVARVYARGQLIASRTFMDLDDACDWASERLDDEDQG